MGGGFSIEQIPDLSGKTILVTGANTGIGYVSNSKLF
jgi:short-subunit dehydrogenase